MLTAFPSLSQGSTDQEGSPEPVVPPVGKGSPGWTSSSPSLVRCLLGVPLQSRLMEESVELDPWESDCGREGGGACSNEHSDLGRLSSYSQCPSSPNQQLFSSVEPRWWHSLTKELRGVHICLIWDLKEPCHPWRLGCPSAQAEELNNNPINHCSV